MLNGKVVSVTTDGFVTDIECLEDKIINNVNLNSTLLKEFIKLRTELSDIDESLENKKKGVGIVA